MGFFLVGLLLVGCGGPSMRVTFHELPRPMQSVTPSSCHLLSRSPMAHILRISLEATSAGQPAAADSKRVKLSVTNTSRGLGLGVVEVDVDGQPHEITLEGPAKTGETLEVSGNFSVGGKQGRFSQACQVD